MTLWREVLGEALRRLRQRQGRTLRDVSATARVSLGYLSEVERGRKEPSSELLAAICAALGVTLSDVLAEVLGTVALQQQVATLTAPVPAEALAAVGASARDAACASGIAA